MPAGSPWQNVNFKNPISWGDTDQIVSHFLDSSHLEKNILRQNWMLNKVLRVKLFLDPTSVFRLGTESPVTNMHETGLRDKNCLKCTRLFWEWWIEVPFFLLRIWESEGRHILFILCFEPYISLGKLTLIVIYQIRLKAYSSHGSS